MQLSRMHFTAFQRQPSTHKTTTHKGLTRLQDLRMKRRRKRQATTFPLRHAHLLGYQQDLECLLVCEGRSDGAVARVQSMALKMAPGNPSASRRLLMKQIFGYKVKFTLRGDTTDLCCACKLAWKWFSREESVERLSTQKKGIQY